MPKNLNAEQFGNLIRQATRKDMRDPTIRRAMQKAKISTWGSRDERRALKDLQKLGDALKEDSPDSEAAKAWFRRGTRSRATRDIAREHYRVYQNLKKRIIKLHQQERAEEVEGENAPASGGKTASASSVGQKQGPRRSIGSSVADYTASTVAKDAKTSAGSADDVAGSVSDKPKPKPKDMNDDDFDALRQQSANLPDIDIG